MIITKVAFLESRLSSNQSEQFKKFSKTSDWLEKSQPFKKAAFVWSCKQANDFFYKVSARFSSSAFDGPKTENNAFYINSKTKISKF